MSMMTIEVMKVAGKPRAELTAMQDSVAMAKVIKAGWKEVKKDGTLSGGGCRSWAQYRGWALRLRPTPS